MFALIYFVYLRFYLLLALLSDKTVVSCCFGRKGERYSEIRRMLPALNLVLRQQLYTTLYAQT
jgi:hypothetical protein